MVFFSFKTNFFFAKTRDGFEGVQRRGPVKGAVCPRSSKTLDSEHRWNDAGFERRGLSGEKMKHRRLQLRTPNGREEGALKRWRLNYVREDSQ
jgi:hypothetical protein